MGMRRRSNNGDPVYGDPIINYLKIAFFSFQKLAMTTDYILWQKRCAGTPTLCRLPCNIIYNRAELTVLARLTVLALEI